MAEFSGSLASIPLDALVELLGSLRKSGDALIDRDEWTACLSFEDGRLIGAAIERDVGPSALEFIGAAMHAADFQFWEGPPTLDANLPARVQLPPRCAHDALDAGWAAELPRPEDVPYLLPGVPVDDDDAAQVPVWPVSRVAVAILLEVDGRRSVRSIAWRHGLQRTLHALAMLRDLELIAYQPAAAELAIDRMVEAPPLSAPRLPSEPLAPRDTLDAKLRGWARRLGARHVVLELGQATLASAVLLLAVHLLIQNFRIDGTSMLPTFSAGEAVIINRTAYLQVAPAGYVFGGPRRGDVVVFRAPPQPDVDYIKRVIGLPGESILVQHGQVYVNGQALEEPYVEFPANYIFPGDGTPVTVPPGTYFVLGDNRPDSFDSHAGWVVPAQNLVGRAWLRYWPPSAWGTTQ